MSDRVLRPRARNRPSSVLLSEDMERVRFSSSLRRQKEVAVQNLLNTVAQDRFKSTEHKSFRKRVVFSKKRYTSDDLPNGLLPHAEHPPTATPVVGILKHSVAETEVAVEAVQTETTETPRPARRSRSRQARGPRGGRVSKHESFTEEVRTSPWKSAAESLLASLALSPLCRKRAQQAQVVASEEESVRRAVDFYRSSGEWWNVFPKTDFSYSPLSSFHHREISPGVRTLPNMSRSGLHSTNIYDAQFTPKRDPFSSDSEEETLAKPVHRTRGRNLAFREQESNALSSVLNVIQMSILTVLTFISSFVRSVYEHIYSSVTWKQKPTVIERPVRYHTQRRYRQNLLVHVWFQCREFFSKNYRRTFGVLAPSSSRILSILLVSLFIGLGWWFWNQAPGVLLNFKESVWSEIWTVISYPFMFIQSFVFHISNLIISVTNSLLSLVSSADKITVILFDIITSPLKLLLSVLNLIFYLVETVLSLLHMIFSLILSFKVPFWETETDDSTQGVKTKVLMSQDVQEHVIRDIVDAALRQQEASLISKMYQNDESLHLLLLSKMAKFEESLRLELAAKDAKNSYLQDQLRRSLRRRFITCCRQPEPSAIRAEVWNHIHSPEILVALGAALTESASIEMTGANVPLFNETEIRAWVSSAFLEKDDFDVKVANITKFLNDEVERRSRDSQLIWTTLRDLQSKLSDPYRNGLAAAGASPSSSAPFTTSHETLIHRIVDSALARYDADKTGMADYALESQGGQVVSTRCTETYQVKSPTLSVFGVPLWYPSNSPRTVIQPGMHPGECWAFVGSQGYLVIQLSHRIRVTGFTYEHISPVLLPTGKMDSAPKEFAVYGLRSEEDSRPFLLGDYHYLQNSTSMQHFSVQHAGVQPFQLIEIQVKSNHGNINYTCMYRFRVHGSLS